MNIKIYFMFDPIKDSKFMHEELEKTASYNLEMFAKEYNEICVDAM